METLLHEQVPVGSVLVRRRRYGDKLYLILDNYYYNLDPAMDAVWCACDGIRTVADVVREVQVGQGWEGPVAEVIVRDTLKAFAEHGLLSVRPAVHAAPPIRGQQA